MIGNEENKMSSAMIYTSNIAENTRFIGNYDMKFNTFPEFINFDSHYLYGKPSIRTKLPFQKSLPEHSVTTAKSQFPLGHPPNQQNSNRHLNLYNNLSICCSLQNTER